MLWLIAAALFVIYACGIFFAARLSLYPPRIPVFLSPGALGSPQEEVVIESESGVQLRGWWMQASEPRCIAVLCHGYVMNRSELAPVAFRLWQTGVSCLLFDFRAHGRSKGSFSTIGWLERRDVAAAVAFAKERNPNLPVMLIGSSMGSAAAAFAMSEDPRLAQGLVLDSAYSRLDQAIPGWWRFIGGRTAQILLAPVGFVAAKMSGLRLRDADVTKALSSIDAPVRILHGRRDDLALPQDAERNHAALRNPYPIVWFEGCGHSEGRWIWPDKYWGEVLGLLDLVVLNGL